MTHRVALLATALSFVSGCATSAPPPEVAPGARMALVGPSGAAIGAVHVVPETGAVLLRVDASGLTPGSHGVHLHAVGKCEGPDFTSAAAHWNPAGKQHGHQNPAGPHAGDLGNLTVGADGRATSTLQVPGADLAALHDADGSALVIHAAADDEKTDPSGNSGARIACAVL